MRIKLWLFLGVFVLSIIIVLYWLFTHAYLEITTDKNSPVAYTLTNQRTGEAQTYDSATGNLKKLVRKGAYEVLGTNADGSYFSVVNTGGFLSTTTLSAGFNPESYRKFVGDEPAPCMVVLGGKLISYGCSSKYTDARIHQPATSSQPTFTKANESSGVSGLIESIHQTPAGPLAIVYNPVGNDLDSGSPHTAYRIDDELNVIARQVLKDLNPRFYYKIAPTDDGFMAFSDNLEKLFTYKWDDLKAPRIISPPAASNPTLLPVAADTKGKLTAILYSNNRDGEVASLEESNPEGVKTELAIIENNTSTSYKLSGQYLNLKFCGQNKICALSGDVMDVLELSGKKARVLYTVSGVKSIESSGDKLLLIRKDLIIRMDIEKRTGYIDYSFGGYEYCGLRTNQDNYLLCAINDRNRKAALLVDGSNPNSDSIDKKVNELAKLSEIKSISAYGQFIYISPEVGSVVLNPQTGYFGFDKEKISQANKAIDNKIKELGIDTSAYKIINPLR